MTRGRPSAWSQLTTGWRVVVVAAAALGLMGIALVIDGRVLGAGLAGVGALVICFVSVLAPRRRRSSRSSGGR